MINLSFTEFEEYAEAIQHVDLRCMVTGVKQMHWSRYYLEVDSIHIQGGFEGCPMIFEGATHRGFWTFYLQRTGELGLVNGLHLDTESVTVAPPDAQFCFNSPGEFNSQTIHIPTEILFPINIASGWSHKSVRVLKPGYGLVNRLRTLIDRFIQASAIEPLVVTTTAAVANFSETLLDTARQILATGDPAIGHDRLAASRCQLVSTAIQFVDDCPEKSLSINGLAQIAGVSERKLRFAFVDSLGMSPLKYLSLRRFHQAREVLRGAAPDELTVSSVAAQLGFWDLGRFAGNYHRIFGEYPSESLRSTSSAPPRQMQL